MAKSDVVWVTEWEASGSNVGTPAPQKHARGLLSIAATTGARGFKATGNAGYLLNGGTFRKSEGIFALGSIKIPRDTAEGCECARKKQPRIDATQWGSAGFRENQKGRLKRAQG